MSLAFHACPPRGQWMNDPNALVHAGGAWRLFVQHRDDAPAFQATGWARLSSPDGLDWRFDGQVIRPDDDWAYSGSVRVGQGGLTAMHTAHDAVTGLERQVVRTSGDAGLTWSEPAPLIDAAHDVRDPFACPEGALLLARPCGWSSSGEASQLGVWREGLEGWREAGRIGPWHPPGVMWEVPVLTRIDGRDVLLISTVDRRGGGADCTVHAWAGTLTQDGFVPDTDWPPRGQRIDLGPDFYAAMAASDGRIIAWLSSWATARAMPWPGFAGGPISLARRLTLAGNRVRHRVAEGIAATFARRVVSVPVAGLATASIDGSVAFSLRLASVTASATITGDPGRGSVTVSRVAEPPLDWTAHHDGVLKQCSSRRLSLFVDGPAVELFIEPDGVAVSLALPTDGAALQIGIFSGDAAAALAWTIRD